MQAKRRLNLGCGEDYQNDWINIDKSIDIKCDVRRDVERGLPFEDNSIDEVYSKFMVEHIKDTVFFWNEVWRVCKPNARVNVLVPDFNSPAAIDFDHKSFWNTRKFQYLNKDKRGDYTGLECNFEICDTTTREKGTVLDVVLKVIK